MLFSAVHWGFVHLVLGSCSLGFVYLCALCRICHRLSQRGGGNQAPVSWIEGGEGSFCFGIMISHDITILELRSGSPVTYREKKNLLNQIFAVTAVMDLNGNVWDVEIVLPEAGKFPQGFMMGLLGFLIGLTWWAMCMMIGTCGCKICPKQKDGNVLKQWWNMNMFDLFTGSISVSSLREYSSKDTETLRLYRWICRIKRLNAFLQASGGHESAEFIPNLPDDPISFDASVQNVPRHLCQHCRFPDHWRWEPLHFHFLHDFLCNFAEQAHQISWFQTAEIKPL